TAVLGEDLETGDLDRSGLFSVPLRRHRLRLGDSWGRSARTYLLLHPLAGLRKNRRSSLITLPALAADTPFAPPRRPQVRLGMSSIRRPRPSLGIGRLPEFTASRVASQFEFERLDASLLLATRFLYVWRKARKRANEPSREHDDRMCG